VRILFNNERECAGVIGMGMCDQEVVRPASLTDGAQIGKLVVLDTAAGARRNADSYVYQQQLATDLDQRAACTDFIRAA
jgi:hypothetical protein